VDFDSKIAIVTGGGSGIGEAVAHRIVRGGGTAVLIDVREEAAASAAHRLGNGNGKVLGMGGDVTSAAHMREITENVVSRFGRIDILVNSAGVTHGKPFRETSEEEYQKVMAINAGGVWNASSAVAPVMLEQGGGAIVNVSSVAALKGGGLFGTAAYATSKGAVISLSKAVARELAPTIRCNAVCPSLTMTEMGRHVVSEKGGMGHAIGMTPLNRPAEPSEVAAVICFLASDDASYVTGQVYNVDGGVSL
jgi:NAD(P)-dependent dehydrogenase (short-subunit alcohol dehydrogenase family)